mmetsp:Transcript_36666/g.43818  ORF Transcript_36666/g.43818 Transcript_36666/m.43818 type:complete len:167 (-) Transcript_36666:313-813(-)
MARWMESHLDFRMTTMLVNEHRREEGKERVGVSAVMNAFYRLQPKVNIIEKMQSGGLNQAWMDASYNIAKQMQIMLGRISDNEVMTDSTGTNLAKFAIRNSNMNGNANTTIKHTLAPFCYSLGIRHYDPPPPWFDQNCLRKLTEEQIAWWDECHIEQQGGKVGDRA